MSGQTPLQRLDDAVHEFVAALNALHGWDPATVAGWVLAYQEQTYVTDENLDSIAWRGGYSLSPGLSEFTAAGLADYLTNTIRRLAFGQVVGDDEDA